MINQMQNYKLLSSFYSYNFGIQMCTIDLIDHFIFCSSVNIKTFDVEYKINLKQLDSKQGTISNLFVGTQFLPEW